MATLYDDISLGYHACGGSKVGKLYSFKPTDGSGDFTVLSGSVKIADGALTVEAEDEIQCQIPDDVNTISLTNSDDEQQDYIRHNFVDETNPRVAQRNTSFTGTVRYISPTGNDTNNGLTVGAPKKTITSAYAVSANGDIIQLLDGTYNIEDESGGYALINTSTKGVLIRGNATDRTATIVRRSTSGSYVIRFRDCKECRIEDVTFQNNQNQATVYVDNGYNRSIVLRRLTITHSSAGSTSFPVYFDCVRTETNTLHLELSDSILTNSSAVFCRIGTTGINTNILLMNNTINHDGSELFNVVDGNQGVIAMYGNTLNQNSDHLAVRTGFDTTTPTNGVTGLFDFRSNSIIYSSTFGQHALLLGRGTKKALVQNNVITSSKIDDVSTIGIVIKATSDNINDVTISGNYISASRGLLLKGGSGCTIVDNTSISTHSTVSGFGIEFDNTHANCVNNIVLRNNLIGKAGMIRLAADETGTPTYDSLLTCNVNDNRYYSYENDVYCNDADAGIITWEEKTEFWGISENDSNSVKLNNYFGTIYTSVYQIIVGVWKLIIMK